MFALLFADWNGSHVASVVDRVLEFDVTVSRVVEEASEFVENDILLNGQATIGPDEKQYINTTTNHGSAILITNCRRGGNIF
ncbi:hypothetical protein [Natronorubrum sediminis]|uniref:hypothetical protein n=1 Tax=Natronorubrum sediminis TaxID=640943 RepID=UPI00111513FD|nr:hypothetical protein [Natronorubrum sediminis]